MIFALRHRRKLRLTCFTFSEHFRSAAQTDRLTGHVPDPAIPVNSDKLFIFFVNIREPKPGFLCIRVPGMVENAAFVSRLDEFSRIHDRNPVTDISDDPISCVMKMTAIPILFLIFRIRSIICACIVTSSAVVGSSAIKASDCTKRHGNHDPLAHASENS